MIFEGSGHYPFAEEPEAFRDAVRAWLARTRFESSAHLGV